MLTRATPPARPPIPAPAEQQAWAETKPPDTTPVWSGPAPPETSREEQSSQPAAPAAASAAPGQGQGVGAGGPGGEGSAQTAGRGQGASGRGAGGSGSGDGPGDDYFERLRRWLARYKRWPPGARERKEQGRSLVTFTLMRDGTVLDARIEHSSGFADLDAAVLQMMQDGSPVPPLPERFTGDHIVVTIPVEYSIGLLDRLF